MPGPGGAVRATLIGAVVALAGCGSSNDDDAGSRAPSPSPTTTGLSTPATSGPEGTWRTAPITVRDMTRTLRAHGLGKWVRRFERNAPISGKPTTLILRIRDGDWDLAARRRGGALAEIDYDARYEVDGDRVVVSHEGESNTYRWTVRGRSLGLRWLRTTYGAFEGVPEEVFQRALYMTSEFTRE